MTFPTVIKKSGPITIPKTGSGSKASSPVSPSSPGSLLNPSAKMMLPGSSVKPSLTSKAPEKTNAGSSVKKPTVPLKSLTVKPVTKPVIDAKLEPVASAAKGVTKSVTKPPPLNIKVIDAKGLQSPKTPTSIIKTLTLTKSTTTTKPASKPIGVVRSPSITKPSLASVSSPIKKLSQATTGVKCSTTSPAAVKSLAVSSPVAKSAPTSILSKKSTMNSAVPKSPSRIINLSTLTVRSVPSSANKENSTSLKSKEQATAVKPTTPVKKAAILSVKSSTVVKSPSTPTKKPLTIPRSPSTASSIKPISLKTPTTPSKLLTKEPSKTTEISSVKLITKSSVISKSSPTTKAIIKEPSVLSLVSAKSSTTINSTISAKSSTLKANVTSSSSSVSKNLAPKSPLARTKPLAVTKVPSSLTVKIPPLSIVKTPSSPMIKTLLVATKTPLSPTLKARTPSSPTVKSRTPSFSSLSLVKPPLSPTVRKMVPTKLILSPGLPKSKPLSSSRLSSVSTESLASRTSLKSPMSPRPSKAVTKSPSKIIKKTEEPKVKGIRGGQPIRKTIEIPGITELPSSLVFNKQETLEFDFSLENSVESVLKDETESTNAQLPEQDSPAFEKLETHRIIENVDDNFSNDEGAHSNIVNAQYPEVQDHNLETIKEDSVEPSTIPLLNEQKQDDVNILLDFEVVKKDECVPRLNSISQSDNNCVIAFDDDHFNGTNENVVVEQSDETQSCIIDMDDHFEPMNDKLVLGDVPFETDSSLGDISDNEQTIHKEVIENENRGLAQNDCVDDVFIFTDNLSTTNFDSADSNENFIHQFMPKSIKRSEGSSSISTDDGSLLSRKSYSEAVSGSPKDGEFYFDYDFEMVDDCLDFDEGRSVFVEVTEKEFPELKPKDLSGKRRRNKKQKKRNYSNRTESQSDSCTEINYNPEDFDGNEFSRYIKMMKDCSFYPNGLFSSDSVKLSTSSSLSWLDISIRTTDDDLIPSTDYLNTYEVFQASNLSKDFIMSIIGSNETTTTTNETSWFWKSIEGKHHPHNKANITLSLQPRPKHLTTPRFMTLLALISEAKGYEIIPTLSEHFVTRDCVSRFDDKIRRLMVQGFWLIGPLIKESMSEDEEVNCENPFDFVDGDIGLWWAGINMLDWQEHLKECGGKPQELPNCYQFVIENMGMTRHNTAEAQSIMNAVPDDFMSELDMENFIHTVRNVKYYCGNYFVDSEENLEAQNVMMSDNDDDLIEWENNCVEKV